MVKNTERMIKIIMKNIITMFSHRDIINPENIDSYTDAPLTAYDDNNETYIDLNGEESDIMGFSKILIKFIKKMTTINKDTEMETFLDKTDYKLIIKMDDIPLRLEKQLYEYANIEVFSADEMKINITECDFVPRHKKLTRSEADTIMEVYHFKNKNIKQMCYDDPLARYLNLKVNDVVEITRQTITCGEEIDYRIVSSLSINPASGH